jgi:hypothetical protein
VYASIVDQQLQVGVMRPDDLHSLVELGKVREFTSTHSALPVPRALSLEAASHRARGFWHHQPCHPLLVRCSAMAYPMPLLAPVTNTFSVIPKFIID